MKDLMKLEKLISKVNGEMKHDNKKHVPLS